MTSGSAVRRAWAGAASLIVTLVASASAHGVPSTFGDIWHAVFQYQGCASSGCHLPPTNAGGLSLARDEAWAALVGFGFGQAPQNSAAADNLKMRVDPGRPWNSFLVDKLRAHLKFGEGAPMPYGRTAIPECAIREVERWIAAGAPQTGIIAGDRRHSGLGGCNVDSDPTCAIDPCDPTQPVLAAPPAPPAGQGVQLHFVSSALRGHQASADWTAVPGVAGAITRIDVVARAGTDHVTVTREGDGAPIAVAVGDAAADAAQAESLALPAGYGIPLAADRALHVHQAIVADRFAPAGAAEAYVNLWMASSPAASVEPFVEDLATRTLFVPPRTVGESGGLWQAVSGAEVVALRVWTDRRASRAVVFGPGGELAADGSYLVPAAPFSIPPGGGLGYACVHDDTHLARPVRYGCGAPAAFAMGLGAPAPGAPAFLGAPAPWCAVEADCAACARGPCCVPANFVGGDGVEDGRCTLVGLRTAR